MEKHPKLPMARWLREAFEDSDAAPEDSCAYRWLWVGARDQYCDVSVGNTAGIDWRVRIEPGESIQLGDMRIAARFGIDEEHRIAVLFWGSGGPTPNIKPGLIDQLALEGMSIKCRRRPPANRLKGANPKPKKWVDPDTDGDDWKRN